MLFLVRGVYRCRKLSLSYDLRMPSIQPQHSTTSMACAGVIDGRPERTLWILSQTSCALFQFLRSHFSKFRWSSNV